jgi:uncharacterized protein involved in exopolysaccharide biosynthesis
MSEEDLNRRRTQIQSPSLRELAMVLFRRRRVFSGVAAAVLVAAILYAIAGTKYEANMKVLVRRGRAEAPVSADENAPLDLTRMAVTEEDLNSEVELLRDDEVLRKVVEQTGIGLQPSWLDFLHPREDYAQRVEHVARRLAKKLKVEPVKKTNLIAVRYAAADPQAAAKVLQSVANIYLAKHMEVHRPAGESHFFEQQTAESRRQLEEAERNLLRFGAEHRVVAASQERDLAIQKLSDLDATNRQTQIDVAATQRQVAELKEKVAKLPERTTTMVHTADNPDLLRALKSNLLDLRQKRTDLLMKFEPNHRLVREVEEQIGEAEAAIASESGTPVRDETTDKDAHYEWAKSQLEQAQLQLAALEAKQSAANAQESGYKAMARRLGDDAVAQDDLLSSEHAAQENYLLYVKKREEARMNDALDERGIVNVAIAEQPVAPALPVLSAWIVVMMGFVGAGVSGTAAAFAADHLDPVFCDPDDVQAVLGVTVLASLPEEGWEKFSA